MMRHVYSDDYMGRRFCLRSYNCWHLVREVWSDMTGVDLGDLTPPRVNMSSLDEAAWQAADGARFQRLERAREPCIVLLRARGTTPHVGVLLRRRLLHITAAGVRHQQLSDVAPQFDSVEFYVPSSAPLEAA